jgi:3-hydroxy-9,10-secoandrosta-1,3,5(10)-triene-9,17-dione monooxygenase
MEKQMSIRPPETDVTREVLLQRAEDMVPVLRERATRTEQLRTLPDETVRDFLDAGFYRILQPERFGGYELDLRTFCDVMIEVSRGCGSSGWVLCLTSAHTFHMAACAEDGQIEMYGDTGDFRSPLILAPQGTATPTAGGYRLKGRWNYGSGGEHSNWLAVSAIVPGQDKDSAPADVLLAFVPREEYEIHDNWFSMGLCGTGSKQAIIKNVFVPERRVISQPKWSQGDAPGFGVHSNPFYRTPHMGVFFAEISSICIGLAESAIDVFHARAITKVNPFPPFQTLSRDHAAQRRVGLARAKVDTAIAVLAAIIDEQTRFTSQVAEGTIDFNSQATVRGSMRVQQVGELCRSAIELLFEKSGTSATQSGEDMERIFRDISTVRTHYLMDAERTAENWGAISFGLEPHTPN